MVKEKVIKAIEENQLIESGDKVVICVSGGPDSMCLLHVLQEIEKEKRFSFSICVAHVNHGLRKEAEEETTYVENFCKTHQIPCYIKRVEVKKVAEQEKRGIEETGRKIRYAFFEELAEKVGANKIAIAHNQNDKAETILMNLLRGCGPLGLKGIEVSREGKYIRPLLNVSRIEIEEYCKQKKLQPKIDQSNFDNHYTRNRIRNELLPYLEKEFNPNIIKGLCKLSEIIAEEQNYFEKVVYTIYNELKIEEKEKEIVLNLKGFNKQDVVIKRKLIRYTVSKLFGSAQNLEKIHVDDIITLCERNIGNKYLLPNKNTKVMVQKGKIFFQSLV